MKRVERVERVERATSKTDEAWRGRGTPRPKPAKEREEKEAAVLLGGATTLVRRELRLLVPGEDRLMHRFGRLPQVVATHERHQVIKPSGPRAIKSSGSKSSAWYIGSSDE